MFKRVYVEITNICNLSCDFCPGTHRAAGYMVPERFRLAAERLRPYTDYLYFHVLGEPLLHPQLEQLLGIAAEAGFRVCLTTNGTLLPERAAVLASASALHKVSVSLHSFEGNGGGDPAAYLDGVLGAAARLCDRGVLCSLRLWNEGGGDRRNGEILSYLSRALGIDVPSLPADRLGNRKLADHLYLESGARFDWPDPEAPEQSVQFCHALTDQIAVLWDGTVVPCCLDAEGRMALGNLFSRCLDDILAAPRAQAIRKGFAARRPAESLCRRCGYARRFNR